MSDNKNHIDELEKAFREQLGRYEQDPQPDALEGIRKRMQSSDSANSSSDKTNTFTKSKGFRYGIPSVIVAGIVTYALVINKPEEKNQENDPQQQEEIIPVPDNTTTTPEAIPDQEEPVQEEVVEESNNAPKESESRPATPVAPNTTAKTDTTTSEPEVTPVSTTDTSDTAPAAPESDPVKTEPEQEERKTKAERDKEKRRNLFQNTTDESDTTSTLFNSNK